MLTRPNDVASYEPGDVIGFVDAEKASKIVLGGNVDLFAEGTFQQIRFNFTAAVDRVGSVTVTMDTIQLSKVNLELWLFGQDVQNQKDNMPFSPTERDLLNLLTVVQFDEFQTPGKRVFQSRKTDFMIPLIRDLWGVLVVRSAYTPKASGKVLIGMSYFINN
jgi:hypothetical protein